MSDQPVPRPEDERLESHGASPSEPTTESTAVKSLTHWLSLVLSMVFLFALSAALFYDAIKPYRPTEGATLSARAERADRLREIAEAQRAADQSDAAR